MPEKIVVYASTADKRWSYTDHIFNAKRNVVVVPVENKELGMRYLTNSEMPFDGLIVDTSPEASNLVIEAQKLPGVTIAIVANVSVSQAQLLKETVNVPVFDVTQIDLDGSQRADFVKFFELVSY